MIKKVLILGSGALKIGEAGEFDYSGSQAIKALKEEGVKVVLVNPNIATIQTSGHLADKVYFLPITAYFVEKVIAKEKPEGILLGFGGQTALNCGIELFRKKILQKNKVKVLGTSIKTIIETEDRLKFAAKIKSLKLPVPKSIAAVNIEDGLKAAKEIGFPLILRGGFSLGGVGSAVVGSFKALRESLEKALAVSPQILIEEYLEGWKEIEYEVVRDKLGNCVAVCNMENMDPMGIHTGESIVAAPSQTLTSSEYFKLRQAAIAAVDGLKIIGECNIQFALKPQKFEYRIIEINARLSRSSALASKATGYPLAFVAAKLALGYLLPEIKNSVTGTTSSFFEPALDYVVIKIPRWDLAKFEKAGMEIGSEMKSVGEVMAIGRSFEEALQKAVRSLNLEYEGIMPEKKEINKLRKMKVNKLLNIPTVERLNLIAVGLLLGMTVEEIEKKTLIDKWFLQRIEAIVNGYKELQKKKLTARLLRKLKRLGFSDQQIGELKGVTWKDIRRLRKKYGIIPYVKQIDTLAGEFPAKTNYLYLTYHGETDDLSFKRKNKQIAVLGSGPYHIGSSVEFDWCAVMAVDKLKKLGYETAVVNCNPETVSTDYDISDRLYFEELTFERILDIYEKEQFLGIILSMGGQAANNLAVAARGERLPILGTDPLNIDKAEDRSRFSHLLDKLQIGQPHWETISSKKKVFQFVKKVGFPILIRPSYVLSGTAMKTVYNMENLSFLLKKISINKKDPTVVSQFIDEAKEIEVDAVADAGKMIAYTILSHIENAGVHSGDATLVLRKNNVGNGTLKKIEAVTKAIARSLYITGPFNIQFLAKHGVVLVIECNVRSSRSFPFSSKVTGVNLIHLAIESMMGKRPKALGRLIPSAVGVKAAQFSFGRLRGVDPILQVEMASTGEVGCFGRDLEEAYLNALLSAGFRLPRKKILLTIGDCFKADFLPFAKKLQQMKYQLFATEGTASYLKTFKIPANLVLKGYQGGRETVVDYIKKNKVDLVINLRDKEIGKSPRLSAKERSDGYLIRRSAADYNLPLITNEKLAKLFIRTIAKKTIEDIAIEPWQYYLNNNKNEKNKP